MAQAHVDLLKYLETQKTSSLFNCGYGDGFSVKEVISELENIVGHSLNVEESARRAGDPVSIVANNTKIKTILGWQPKHNDLKEILTSALKWEKTL